MFVAVAASTSRLGKPLQHTSLTPPAAAGSPPVVVVTPQGSHCAKITVTVDGMQTRPAIPGLSRVSGVQTVCWYRLAGQATAKLQFDMCSSPVCE